MKKSDFDYNIDKYTLLFYNNLSEKDKRLFAGLESMKIGYYGVCEVSKKLNIHKHTIRTGKKELLSEKLIPCQNIRNKGGGRKKTRYSS